MGVTKKERSLTLRITEDSDMEDDDMKMITKYFKKKKEQVQPKKGNDKGSTKVMLAAWGESSDDDDDVYEHLCPLENLMKKLRACKTESANTVLKNQVHALDTTIKLRSENLKLKLGTGKKSADHKQLTLEEKLGKIKDELYNRDELVKVLKEDLNKVKHELDRTCKCKRSSDALLWLQEHHSSNKRGLGFGNSTPKWDPKRKYFRLPENKIYTHCGNTDRYKSECIAKEKVQVKGNIQIWYMDSGCSKHMTGNKNQFLSLEDLKRGNVSFGNGKKGEIIGVEKVGKTDSHSIENVYLIDGLKYSLISVSQLCDRGNGFLHLYKMLYN
ncbi:uncharacterized protein [Nicotiana sylvestris]|uniref:uncharacterized protein n=1 Tax=Nicotiana sylvestris TaxID=4096 RepID=UPI00388C7F85